MKLDPWIILTFTPLLLCSILGLALIIERCAFLFRLQRLTNDERETIKQQLKAGQQDSALLRLRDKSLFYISAIDDLLQFKDESKTLQDDAAATAMISIVEKLQSRMPAIITIATLAPMFGLLGTVVGLMRAFRDIGLHSGPVEPAIVANGLWQALSTTVAGLLVAAFCIVVHALLASRIRRLLSEAQQMLNALSLAISQAQSSNSTKSVP